MRRHRAQSLISVVLALLVSAGCGSGFSGAKSPPTEDGLRQAIQLSTMALFKPDAKAFYKYFSKECRDTVTMGDLTFALMFGGMFLEGMAGTETSDFRAGDIEIRSLTSSSAEARFAVVLTDGSVFADLEDSDWSGWVYEDGGWKTTDCEEFADAGDFGESGSAFGGPDCALLVDGQPVPDDFSEESRAAFNLECEDDFGDPVFAMTLDCWNSDRTYIQNEFGFAFLDDRIYRTGDVVGCLPQCSRLTPGEPIPDIFNDTSREGFNLNCEDPNGNPYISYSWDCWDSNRKYVQVESGYAFVEDRIFRSGTSPSC